MARWQPNAQGELVRTDTEDFLCFDASVEPTPAPSPTPTPTPSGPSLGLDIDIELDLELPAPPGWPL